MSVRSDYDRRERRGGDGRRRRVYIQSSSFLPLSRLEARTAAGRGQTGGEDRRKKLPTFVRTEQCGQSLSGIENAICIFGEESNQKSKSAAFPVQLRSDHPVSVTAPADRGRAYQHLNGLKNLYSASLPRRSEQVATAHKKPRSSSSSSSSPHPAERRGFNSGSSDVTRRHSDGDGDGDRNLNAAAGAAAAAANDLRDEDGRRTEEGSVAHNGNKKKENWMRIRPVCP